MNKNETTKMEEFAKQQHICLKYKTCSIIDRGLAICHSRGNMICSMSACIKTKKEEENE